MKYKDIAELTTDECNQKLVELRQEYFNFRTQHKTGQLENTSKLRIMRRDIARVITSIRIKVKASDGKGKKA